MGVASRFWLRLLPWAFLLGGFAVYGLGAAPGLSILDSGEFLGVGGTLGVAHPTGYPLYALLGQVATFVPWGDKAFLINLVSAAAAAGAAFFVALAVRELAGVVGMGLWGEGLAVAAAGLWVLGGRTLWSVGTMAEVYALNALFWGALLWGAVRLRRTGAARELYVLALLGGLSLANHVTIILFFPALIFIGWPGKERARGLVGAWPLALAIFLAGASVNLYTPLRAAQKPLFNWNDPSTLGSLCAHLGGFQYRGLLLSGEAGGVSAALGKYWEWGKYDALGAAFAAAALVYFFIKRRPGVAVGLIAYFVGYLGFCAAYGIGDIHYYFIPLHLAAASLIALGLGVVVGAVARRGPAWRAGAASAALALTLAAAAWSLVSNFRYADRRAFTFAEAYGERLLASLPSGAFLLSSGDTNGNLTWYNVYVRRRRPDVAVSDQARLANRGYIKAVGRRHADLVLPSAEEVALMAAEAFAGGDSDRKALIVRKSSDFILPGLLEPIIVCNAASRRVFWGLGDPGEALQAHLVPYDVVMEVVLEEPPRARVERRAAEAAAAFTGVMARVRRESPAELRDEPFREHAILYYVSLANHLADRGLSGPQTTLLESYVRLFPEDANGYENLARLYAAAGRAAEAAESYRRALALAPGDAPLRAKLVKALAAAGRGDEAAAVASVEGAAPGEADYLRAVACREAGKTDEALAAFAAAAPYFARDADFWLEFGLARDAGGDYAGAARAFDRALELDPGRSWTYTARGVERLKLGDAERARADFEAALELNGGDAQAHYNLACLYAREGRTAAALEELEAAFELEPDHYVAVAREDEDLASCRGMPAFGRLMAAYGGAAER